MLGKFILMVTNFGRITSLMTDGTAHPWVNANGMDLSKISRNAGLFRLTRSRRRGDRSIQSWPN